MMPERCPICGWPMAKIAAEGCIPGNCSYRPESGSPEWYRIQKHKEILQTEYESRKIE